MSNNEVLRLCMKYDIPFKSKKMSYGELLCLVCNSQFSGYMEGHTHGTTATYEYRYHAKGWEHKRAKDEMYRDLNKSDPYGHIQYYEVEQPKSRKVLLERISKLNSTPVQLQKSQCESRGCSSNATKVCRWCRKNRCHWHHQHCCADD